MSRLGVENPGKSQTSVDGVGVDRVYPLSYTAVASADALGISIFPLRHSSELTRFRSRKVTHLTGDGTAIFGARHMPAQVFEASGDLTIQAVLGSI